MIFFQFSSGENHQAKQKSQMPSNANSVPRESIKISIAVTWELTKPINRQGILSPFQLSQ